MIALTWDRTWDLYIWALFTSPSGMNSALKIRRPFYHVFLYINDLIYSFDGRHRHFVLLLY